MSDESRDAWPPPLPAPTTAGSDGMAGPGDAPPRPPARRAGWAGLQGAREDRRSALLTVLVLALTGLPAGLLWLWLAPRASFRITATGVEPIGGTPSSELFMADDGVYLLILAGLGLLAGVAVWLLRRRRGAVVLTAVAAGMVAASVVAWQLGELLGPAPTKAQLADIGGTVTTGMRLGAVAAVAVGPFAAVLAYLVACTLMSRDDLGRDDTPAGALPAAPVEQPTR